MSDSDQNMKGVMKPLKEVKLFRGLVLFWTLYWCAMNSNPACHRETTSAVLLTLHLWVTQTLEHVLQLLRKTNVRRSRGCV